MLAKCIILLLREKAFCNKEMLCGPIQLSNSWMESVTYDAFMKIWLSSWNSSFSMNATHTHWKWDIPFSLYMNESADKWTILQWQLPHAGEYYINVYIYISVCVWIQRLQWFIGNWLLCLLLLYYCPFRHYSFFTVHFQTPSPLTSGGKQVYSDCWRS